MFSAQQSARWTGGENQCRRALRTGAGIDAFEALIRRKTLLECRYDIFLRYSTGEVPTRRVNIAVKAAELE